MFIRIRTSAGDDFEFDGAELKAGVEQVEVHQGGAVVFSEPREAVTYWSVNEDLADEEATDAGDGAEPPHLRRVK